MDGMNSSHKNLKETSRNDFSVDSDANLFGTMATPEESLDELYSLVEQCEPNCSTCRKFILQLTNHIRATHSRSQHSDNLDRITITDEPQKDTVVVQNHEKCVEVTPNINLVKTEDEDMKYSDMENVSEYELNIPTIITPSSAIRPPTVTVPHQDYSSIFVDNIKSELYDEEEVSVEDPLEYNKGQSSGTFELLGTDSLSGQTPYKCKICKAGFSTQLQLNIHSRAHATKETPYWCVHCKKGYNIKYYFDRHMKIHTGENGEKPFQCDECGQRFRIRDSLKAHKVKHKVGEKHKCDICGKCFCQPGILAAHVRSHTGERPFKCEHCDACFHRKPTLTRHMWTHTEEKPYKCQTCGSGFIRRDYFLDHIREHNGEKPYVCKMCGTRFSSDRNLGRHVRTCSNPQVDETSE